MMMTNFKLIIFNQHDKKLFVTLIQVDVYLPSITLHTINGMMIHFSIRMYSSPGSPETEMITVTTERKREKR